MKAVLRCQKIKRSDLSSTENHNKREYEKLSTSEKATFDKSRTHLNEYSEGSLKSKVLERVSQVDNKLALSKKSTNYALEFVVSASSEFFYDSLKNNPNKKNTFENNISGSDEVRKIQESLNVDISKEFFKSSIDWFEKTFGKDNVVDTSIHYDEKTPHLHLIITPITKDNKLSAKEVFTPVAAKKWQTSFAEHVRSFGLERGQENSTAIHQDHHKHNEYIQNLPKAPQIDVPKLAEPTLFTTAKTVHASAEAREKAQSKKYSFYKSFYQENVKVVAERNLLKDQNKELTREINTMKPKYEKIKENELDKLRSIDLASVLIKQDSFKTTKEGISTRFQNEQFNIVVTGHKFYDNKSQQSGFGAISLLEKLYDLNFKEAVSFLSTEFEPSAVAKLIDSSQHTEDKQQIIESAVVSVKNNPPAPVYSNEKKVIDYLTKTRNIDQEIVKKLVDSGSIYADRNNNAVFLSSDKKSAFARGTIPGKSFKRNYGSDVFEFVIKPEGFLSRPDKVFVFESAIDALSYYTMHKKPGTYISTNGNSSEKSSKIQALIELNKTVIACFDNDDQGKLFKENLKEKVLKAGKEFFVAIPRNKDFSEDLAAARSQEKKELAQAQEQKPTVQPTQQIKKSFTPGRTR